MAFVLGAFFCILTILIIATIWLAGGTKSDFNAQIALAVLSLILIPPHLMFYDIGLLVLAYAVVLQKINRRKIELVLLLWFFGFTQIFSKWIGFSPLFFLVVFSFILSLKLLVVPATRKATEQS
jgi:apolipoprotein N-acyltransferase